MTKQEEKNIKSDLPTQLKWLADAPLFIDADHVGRFFDAVVQPRSKVVRMMESRSTAGELSFGARGKAGAKIDIAKGLGGLLGSLFSGLGEVSAEVEAQGSGKDVNSASTQHEAVTIDTPQRQLLALTLHYLTKQQQRIFLVDDATAEGWRTPEVIGDVPRALVFLELPGAESSSGVGKSAPPTMLIPTAAEFANGAVIPLFDRLERKNGERPPEYPEKGDATDLRNKRKEYWKWFQDQFSPSRAMQIIENAAKENGRLNWVDFRVPLTMDGDTLHLHVCPNGNFDTGVFAYNFIKRGYKHGIRLVGTLKSEPDMNVLAIYDR